MKDYGTAYETFDDAEALSVLSGDEASGFNAAVECCDRWCGPQRVALRALGRTGAVRDYTFEELRDASESLAHQFARVGVGPGDRVAGLLPRTPELVFVILATWRLGAVYQPLFTAFGPKAIEHRLQTSGAKLVVTDPGNRSKLSSLPSSTRILLTQPCSESEPTDLVMVDLASGGSPFEPVPRRLDDPFLIMFTSGTTGLAKSLLVPLKAISAFVGYMRDAVDLRKDDNYWNIADPGWAYGLYYGIAGPLAMGHPVLLRDGPFTAESAVEVIRDFGITNLAGAPTAFRIVMNADPSLTRTVAGRLRAVSSAGEPLSPDIARWYEAELGVKVYDHFGQTEIGMVVCNHHALSHPVTPGSAGFPVPGHRVVVLDEDGHELAHSVSGELALDVTRSQLFWFKGYEGKGPIQSRYYRTGDTAERNPDGSISFVARADDVINSSGYRIGPFDVESSLVEHGAILDAAVIGKPDPERTEIVKAFVILREGVENTPELVRSLQEHVKSRLSAHAYPREVEVVDELPRTPSGKVQRFLLRAREAARASEGNDHRRN